MENELNTYQKEDRLFFNHFTGEPIIHWIEVSTSEEMYMGIRSGDCEIFVEKDKEYSYFILPYTDSIFKTTDELLKERKFIIFNKREIPGELIL